MNLTISDLDFTYPDGVDALVAVSLTLRAGARVALLGPNGAGKTTLVKHLNGLLKPTRGTVRIGDWDTREHSIARLARRVGFCFQNPDAELFKTRVADQVAFGPRNFNLAPEECAARVANALEACELTAWRDAHPFDLSPAQRRWVALASVLAMQTPIVVLDEPTTGQDAYGLARLTRLLDGWRAQRVTVLVVTHDVDFAVEHFDELVLMAGGRVVVRGDARLFANAAQVEGAALALPQLMRLAQALGLAALPARVEDFLDGWAQTTQAAS